MSHHSLPPDAPIGVFDSGIGGLSVLRHIRDYLPEEHLLYFADSGFAPYGDKSEDVVMARSLAIAGFLLQHGAKALVAACNTATAAAIKAMRSAWPDLPIVGIEPGLKPAAALTGSGTVGVLATERTLASEKFNLLKEQVSAATSVRFVTQPCRGLADRIEKGELRSGATAALLRRYVDPLLKQDADTLVLGCTHYPFIRPLLEDMLSSAGGGRRITLVDTGEPVARQLTRLLDERGLRRPGDSGGKGCVFAFTTGSESSLAGAFSNLLNVHSPIISLTMQR